MFLDSPKDVREAFGSTKCRLDQQCAMKKEDSMRKGKGEALYNNAVHHTMIGADRPVQAQPLCDKGCSPGANNHWAWIARTRFKPQLQGPNTP